MRINLESFLPILAIGIFVAAVWYNSFTVPATVNGQVVVPTKITPHIEREVGEVDGSLTIKHNPSGDSLDLDVLNNFVLFPPGVLGSDKWFDANTGKDENRWEIKYDRKRYFYDPGFDFGTYGGYLSGNKEGTDIEDLDVGIRVSPVRWFYGSTSFPDILASNQGIGIGVSLYPEPIHFGPIFDHIGAGYGMFYTFEDDVRRNLFYVSISTRF